MKKTLSAIFVLFLLVSGCVPVTATNAPTTSTGILFADDFTKTSSGWDRFQDYSGVTDYANTGYLIFIKAANMIKWSNPSETFQSNVRIEVDATKPDGTDNNAFGIICRYQDPDNFYYFYISSDGYGGIGKKVQSQHSIISSTEGKLQQIDKINKGVAANHLRADCIDNHLSFYVNGSEVATATDDAFTGGNVGLITRTYDTGGADILFNNFYVYQP